MSYQVSGYLLNENVKLNYFNIYWEFCIPKLSSRMKYALQVFLLAFIPVRRTWNHKNLSIVPSYLKRLENNFCDFTMKKHRMSLLFGSILPILPEKLKLIILITKVQLSIYPTSTLTNIRIILIQISGYFTLLLQ